LLKVKKKKKVLQNQRTNKCYECGTRN